MDLDPALMDELQELSLDKPLTTNLKSAEELEELTVDERLNDIERSVYLLSSGQEVQRVSVITSLPQLLQDSNDDCMRRVVPKVREVLHVADAEMQLAACNAFVDILGRQLVPLQHYAQTFLKSIITGLDNKDADIANAWLETLLDVMDILPKDMIKKEILGMAISKGQLQKSVQSRQSACRILGKIATKFEPFILKTEIVPVVDSLCQDVDYEVRACMCRHLNPVARGLGLEQTKVTILPALVELTNDEESSVRLAGLETVVQILTLLDEDTKENTIIPLVTKLCESALESDDSTLANVAFHIGEICHGLKGCMVEEQRRGFVDFYRKLCTKGLQTSGKGHKHGGGQHTPKASPSTSPADHDDDFFPPHFLDEEPDNDVLCRANAAYNFPAMLLLVGPRHFRGELLGTYNKLCTDPHCSVRKNAAAGLHEIMKLLGNSTTMLQPTLITLLKDANQEVLKGLMPNIRTCIEVLFNSLPQSTGDTKSLQNMFEDLLPALLHCDNTVSTCNNWRLQAQFIEALVCLPQCCKNFPTDVVYKSIVPVLFDRLYTARALPVKHAVCKTLLYIMRHTRKQEHRQNICTFLVQDLCRSSSSFKRKLFIDVCSFTMDLFSRSFFKDQFFDFLLSLCDDPVPNVRMRVCPLMARLKSQINLPSDRALLQQLESCVRRLMRDERDPDVLNAIEKAVEELDQVSPHMEALTNKVITEDDIKDKRKEDEENLMIELEERERREDERNRREKKDSKIPGMRAKGKLSSGARDKGSASSSVGRAGDKNGPINSTAAKKSTTATSLGSPTKATKSSSRKGSASSVSSVSSSSSAYNSQSSTIPHHQQPTSSSSHSSLPTRIRRSSTGDKSSKELKLAAAKNVRSNARGARVCHTPN